MAGRCFVVIPFRPQFHYFYLYLAQYLGSKWKLEVERGDSEIAISETLLDKIRQQILRADLIIADITGANPNVMYEVGFAHAIKKPVLFLTQDTKARIPVDLSEFEHIRYDLSRSDDFIAQLDKALAGHFRVQFADLYAKAAKELAEFNASVGAEYTANTREEFVALVSGANIGAEVPEDLVAELLLPKIIRGFNDAAVVRKYNAWITKRQGTAG